MKHLPDIKPVCGCMDAETLHFMLHYISNWKPGPAIPTILLGYEGESVNCQSWIGLDKIEVRIGLN